MSTEPNSFDNLFDKIEDKLVPSKNK